MGGRGSGKAKSEQSLARAILDGSARLDDVQKLARLVLAKEEPAPTTGDTGCFEHWADCPRLVDGRKRCICSEHGLEEDHAAGDVVPDDRRADQYRLDQVARLAADGRLPGPTLKCNACHHAIEGVGGAWPELVRAKKNNICVECGGKIPRV